MNIFHKRQYQWRITTTNSTISVDENVLMMFATGTSTLADICVWLKSMLFERNVIERNQTKSKKLMRNTTSEV